MPRTLPLHISSRNSWPQFAWPTWHHIFDYSCCWRGVDEDGLSAPTRTALCQTRLAPTGGGALWSRLPLACAPRAVQAHARAARAAVARTPLAPLAGERAATFYKAVTAPPCKRGVRAARAALATMGCPGGVKKRLRPSPVAAGQRALREKVAAARCLFRGCTGAHVVAVAELLGAMRAHDLFMGDVDSFVKALQVDMDGALSLEGFMATLFPLASNAELSTMLSWKDFEAASEDASAAAAGPAPEQLAEIRSIFEHYDANANGLLEKHEVVEALADNGFDSDEVEDLLEQFDTDSDSKLNFEEFGKMVAFFYAQPPGEDSGAASAA